MSIQNKPDYKVFASDAKSGEVETFPDISRGWGVTIDRTGEIPPMEWFNAIGKRADEWLLYLTQRGIPEWDSSLDYPKSAVVIHGDVIYISLRASKGEQPNTTQASWSTLSAFFGLGNYATNTALSNGLALKLDKSAAVQSTGTSTTNVMSQKAVSDSLNTKANTSTQIIAGTGLEGGGSLATNLTLSVKYGASAGTAAQGNDSRIVDALQKGNNLSEVTNPATARSNLGLKGAATRDVVHSPTDSSGGDKLVTQGWMGVGEPAKVKLNDGDDLNDITGANRFFSWLDSSILNSPTAMRWGAGFTFGWSNSAGLTQIVWGSGEQRWYVRQRDNAKAAWSPWQEILHTGNILQSTGTSTTQVMSQKAVTDLVSTHGMGYGQTYKDVTSQRQKGVAYTNSSSKPIFLLISTVYTPSKGESNKIEVSGVTVSESVVYTGTQSAESLQAIVPPGGTYRYEGKNVKSWVELS